MTLSRRKFLGRSLLLGCSAAASPLVTPVTWASMPGENRLVVIILRGAMDGLDIVQPVGDPAFAGYRQKLKTGEAAGAHELDGFFALNAGLGDLMPLWRAGELAFGHAVSTPYRDKRSHFDGQDLLETGSGASDFQFSANQNGWLNRMLTLLPGADIHTAFAVGRERLLLLEGDAPFSAWSPELSFNLSDQAQNLLGMIYQNDPLFKNAITVATEIANEMPEPQMNNARPGSAKILAEFAAQQLNGEARIAAFSIGGWDSHNRQANLIKRQTGTLAEAILALKETLGANWGSTAVVAMTEFGRTVRENGSAGTDHGTGGAMLMAGGALSGAKVHGQWPGLGELDLYQNRDLMPTRDVRANVGWMLRDLFGLSVSDLERVVFPDVTLGDNPRIIA